MTTEMTAEATLDVPMTDLAPSLEAVLMVADQPLDSTSLATAVGYPVDEVERALAELTAEYDASGRGFELRNVAGGWRYYTREEYAGVVEGFVLEGQQARLTQAALETLAVVAYKQPISRARVSAIRGVNVDWSRRPAPTRPRARRCSARRRTSSSGSGSPASRNCPSSRRTSPTSPTSATSNTRTARMRRSRASRSRPSPPTRDHVTEDDEGLVRLHKLLATSGIASRRRCEELMLAGEVEVDGEVVTRLGTKVDPRTAVIRVGGKRLPPASANVYLVLNKPRGVVSTMSDPQGRPTLSDLVSDRPERLFHVGRLDTDTTGLIVLTNDGDFAQRLAHPSYEVDKTYVAEVSGVVTKGVVRRLREGVVLADGPVTVKACRIISTSRERSIVELVIHEGRNRIVRRLLDQVGHPVERLTRTAIGPVRLGRLAEGSLRELSGEELGSLLDSARL